MKGITTKNKKSIKNICIFIFWVLIWQITHVIIGRDIYVPSPFNVFLSLRQLVLQPYFWRSITFSIYRVLSGLAWSILLGITIGIISAMNEHVHDIINPLIIVIKSTPVISFIILAVIWLSSSSVPIFICFLLCFPIIWTNVVTGIRNVDIKLLEMAKVYRIKRLTVIRKIYLPSIIPYVSAACLTAVGLGWKASVAAEVLSLPRNGIGSYVHSAKVYLDTNELFAWTSVVIILSVVFEIMLNKLIKKSTSNGFCTVNNSYKRDDYSEATSKESA